MKVWVLLVSELRIGSDVAIGGHQSITEIVSTSVFGPNPWFVAQSYPAVGEKFGCNSADGFVGFSGWSRQCWETGKIVQFQLILPVTKIQVCFQEIYDSLSELYSALNEQDLWASIWFQRARFPDTKNALRYEQLGMYDVALDAYEKVIFGWRLEIPN